MASPSASGRGCGQGRILAGWRGGGGLELATGTRRRTAGRKAKEAASVSSFSLKSRHRLGHHARRGRLLRREGLAIPGTGSRTQAGEAERAKPQQAWETRMIRLALCLGAVVLLAACAQQSFTSPDAKEAPRENVVVQINDASLLPEPARLKAGGQVAWTNASSYFASVVMPLADETKFECKDMRPNFSRVSGAIQSINMAGDMERVTLPCSMQPGTYPYTVNLFGRQTDMDNPAFTLSGSIIVE
jgi:plastocyanin